MASPLDRKLVLQDLFEGCFEFETAWQMAGYGREQREQARRIWDRWTREMDEEGSYTF